MTYPDSLPPVRVDNGPNSPPPFLLPPFPVIRPPCPLSSCLHSSLPPFKTPVSLRSLRLPLLPLSTTVFHHHHRPSSLPPPLIKSPGRCRLSSSFLDPLFSSPFRRIESILPHTTGPPLLPLVERVPSSRASPTNSFVLVLVVARGFGSSLSTSVILSFYQVGRYGRSALARSRPRLLLVTLNILHPRCPFEK